MGIHYGKKPFHGRSHNHHLILDILEGKRPEITEDTPEFYADLMKKCWDPNPKNRPDAKEIYGCLKRSYKRLNEEKEKIIELAETKRQEIIRSKKYLIDEKDHKNHPESFYTSRPLDKLIQQSKSLKHSSNEQYDTSINNLSIREYLD